jgi:hypothetical protein
MCVLVGSSETTEQNETAVEGMWGAGGGYR